MKVLINNKEQDNIKAIQIDDYWVVVDTKAEIKLNQFRISKTFFNEIGKVTSIYGEEFEVIDNKGNISGWATYENNFNIIASTKFIDKSIPVIKFVEQSVEELAELKFPYKKTTEWVEEGLAFEVDGNEDYRIGFVEGFNQAKSSDKKWSDKDVKNAYIQGRKDFYLDAYYKKHSEEYLQSLNQAKLPDVINLKMEEICCDTGLYSDFCKHLKCTNKILKLKTTSTPEGEVIIIKI